MFMEIISITSVHSRGMPCVSCTEDAPTSLCSHYSSENVVILETDRKHPKCAIHVGYTCDFKGINYDAPQPRYYCMMRHTDEAEPSLFVLLTLVHEKGVRFQDIAEEILTFC